MTWQDFIVSAGSIIFAYGAITQIIYGYKTKKGLIAIQFSILNIIATLGLIAVFVSFSLIFAIILNTILVMLWLILLIQRLKYGSVD